MVIHSSKDIVVVCKFSVDPVSVCLIRKPKIVTKITFTQDEFLLEIDCSTFRQFKLMSSLNLIRNSLRFPLVLIIINCPFDYGLKMNGEIILWLLFGPKPSCFYDLQTISCRAPHRCKINILAVARLSKLLSLKIWERKHFKRDSV